MRILQGIIASSRPLPSDGAGIIIQDNFTGTDGTLLNAHTISPINIPVSSWSGTDFQLIGGKACPTLTAVAQSFIETGISDFALSFDFYIDPAASGVIGAGAFFRVVDANNYWSIQLVYDSVLRITKTVGGVGHTIYIPIPEYSQNVTYTFKVICNGDDIVIYMYDGADLLTMFSITDSEFNTATQAALYIYTTDSTHEYFQFDNFEISNTIPETTILKDTFTDTNGTSLPSHTIAPINTPAASYSLVQGNPGIWANNHWNFDVVPCEVSFDAGISNGEITAEFFAESGFLSAFAIRFRYSDANNGWYIFSQDTTFSLVQRQAGVDTVRSTITLSSLPKNFVHRIRVILFEDKIRCYMHKQDDTIEAVSYTSSFNQTATGLGLYINKDDAGTQPAWDNLKIVKIN